MRCGKGIGMWERFGKCERKKEVERLRKGMECPAEAESKKIRVVVS